jgi:hypothetical protein
MSGYNANPPRDYVYKGITPVNPHEEMLKQHKKYGITSVTPPTKTRVNLRIGVFFDGTGNNASNSAMGLRCGAHHPIRPEDIEPSCKPYMTDPEGSYGADVTNIKKLSDLYPEHPDIKSVTSGQMIYLRNYIGGIGTRAGEKDSLVGFATGRGDTGVIAKVHRAFNLIIRQVQALIEAIQHCQIDSITLDVFGFSRGAAAARHFANEVVSPRSVWGGFLQDYARYLSVGFNGYQTGHLRVGFIGLFDTVAAIAGVGNLGGLVNDPYAPDVNLYLDPTFFPRVVHLVARDEVRANFPLSSVAPEHVELALPGAHSDIGGGYLENIEESVLISPMQALDVSLLTHVTSTSIYRDAEQAKRRWIEKGWPEHMLHIVTPEPTPLPVSARERLEPRQKRVYAGLQLKHSVKGTLSRVYLRVMHALAIQNGVPLEKINDIHPDLVLPTELRAISDRFVDGDYSITAKDERLLMLSFTHTSAHWNKPVDDIQIVYVHAPADGVRRLVLPHRPVWRPWS